MVAVKGIECRSKENVSVRESRRNAAFVANKHCGFAADIRRIHIGDVFYGQQSRVSESALCVSGSMDASWGDLNTYLGVFLT